MYTRRLLLALVPLTAALAAGCDPPPGAGGPVKVSKAEYDLVKVGTPYWVVSMTINAEGEELSRSQLGDLVTVLYIWKNPDGSNMTATFQNDRLVSKAQFGLPPQKPASAPPAAPPQGDKKPAR